MGNLLERLSQVLQMFQTITNTRIMMLGLDAAGKTTILYKVKLNETVTTIPTNGFNVEVLSLIDGVTFTVWDVRGQEKFRPLWRTYMFNTQGLLFIVDSSDVSRLPEAKQELFNIITNEHLNGVPVVVVANKQDLPEALSTTEISDRLGLRDIKDRKWFVQGACAVSGDGIYEAMHELTKLVKEFVKH